MAAQHELLEKGLGVNHLRLLMGTSMGCMHSWLWLETYPDFMDAARFPTLTYSGSCQKSGLSGMLGLHGITRPFQLSLAWSPDRVVAEGQLVRADWGMTAMPIVAGRTVRIQVTVPLAPPSHASRE